MLPLWRKGPYRKKLPEQSKESQVFIDISLFSYIPLPYGT
jgi:hypothetical protein